MTFHPSRSIYVGEIFHLAGAAALLGDFVPGNEAIADNVTCTQTAQDSKLRVALTKQPIRPDER